MLRFHRFHMLCFPLHSVAAVRPSELTLFLVTLTDAMRSSDISCFARNQ